MINALRLENILHTGGKILPGGRVQTNQKNARMRPRSKLADIGKIQVLGNQESGFRLCRSPYLSVTMTGKTFAIGGVHVVSEIPQQRT